MFDIDGVLIKGRSAIPEAKAALQLLDKLQIPFFLLTNGGGFRELDRIKTLSKLVGYRFKSNQLVLSHTPMQTLTLKYQRVLVVGGKDDNCRYVANEYGFKNVVLPMDIVKYDESIAPHHCIPPATLETLAKPFDISQPIDAIMIFNDPRDMGTDLQIVMDYLNSDKGYYGTFRSYHSGTPSVPIMFSNNDFWWSNEFCLPRFGQGVFRTMVETLYREINKGYNLERTIYGKPFQIQYDYIAHRVGDADQVYMIGDNPKSDIEGANLVSWESALVRTGVFKDGDEDNSSLGVFDNVKEAVIAIIKH